MTSALAELPTTQDPRVREPLQLADQARAIVVTRINKLDAERMILTLNDAEKRVRAVLDPICETAHQAHKTATAKRAELLKPIEDARQHLRRGCSTIQLQLDQEAHAEAQRRADEQAAQERARLQAAAESLADTDIESAIETLEEAAAVTAVPASTMKVEPPKATGITYRDNWKFGYVNAKGQPIDAPDVALIPKEYLTVNETAVGAVVRGLKERTNIPGIRVYNDRQPVQTGGRR